MISTRCPYGFAIICLLVGVCITLSDAFGPSTLRAGRRSSDLFSGNSSTDRAKENNKKKNTRMLEFMVEPVSNSVGDKPNPADVPIDEDPSADLVRCIAKAADGRKAENIVALRVSPVSTLTSFLVILSGNSRPQNQAIAAAIKDDVEKEFDLRPMGNGVPEGSAESGWMLLDYGEVMCHIMTPKSRLYYNVEGQWRDKGGIEIDLNDVLVPNTVEGTGATTGTMEIVDEEEDPFWS